MQPPAIVRMDQDRTDDRATTKDSRNMSSRPVSCPSTRRAAGMTLIEILVVVSIILVLAGIALPAIGLVRRRAADQRAALVVQQLVQAMDSYRLEDRNRSFPTPRPDLSLSRNPIVPGGPPGNLQQLEDRGYYAAVEQPRDAQGRAIDPWKNPYQYDVLRPAPTAPALALLDWNWDVASSHERAWGRRVDPVTRVAGDGALPFAYVWSLGRGATATDATTWIYTKDARR